VTVTHFDVKKKMACIGSFEWVTKDVNGLMNKYLRRNILFSNCSITTTKIKVVDVGCGTSVLASLLANDYDDVIGVDVKPSIVVKMNKRYEEVENLRFVCMDILDDDDDGSKCICDADLLIDKSTVCFFWALSRKTIKTHTSTARRTVDSRWHCVSSENTIKSLYTWSLRIDFVLQTKIHGRSLSGFWI